MPMRLTLAETQRLRSVPGASALLFLTDRCPVGCEHCSVSSRPDSPRLTDTALFDELLAGLCVREDLRAVAVSGGEPFTERRALTQAVGQLTAAGKAVIVLTSGYWAGGGSVPAWVTAILPEFATVFLSVDTYHEDKLGSARLGRAVRAVADSGTRLVLQVVDGPGRIAAAENLLAEHVGAHWPAVAEVYPTPGLAIGRGTDVFPAPEPRPGHTYGPCMPVNSPTLRYDGTVTACCNEAVIMGRGPDALRRKVTDRGMVAQVLDDFRRDPLLAVIGGPGPRALAGLPGFEALAEKSFATVCDACWAAHDVVTDHPRAGALVTGLARAVGGVR